MLHQLSARESLYYYNTSVKKKRIKQLLFHGYRAASDTN